MLQLRLGKKQGVLSSRSFGHFIYLQPLSFIRLFKLRNYLSRKVSTVNQVPKLHRQQYSKIPGFNASYVSVECSVVSHREFKLGVFGINLLASSLC